MEKIVFSQFGAVTNLDAAHVIDDTGRIVAFVAEPDARDISHTGGGNWYPAEGWDENAFRAAVEAEVASWEARDDGEKLWIQYDPGRDYATEVEVRLEG
jgi:hypothetical protein